MWAVSGWVEMGLLEQGWEKLLQVNTLSVEAERFLLQPHSPGCLSDLFRLILLLSALLKLVLSCAVLPKAQQGCAASPQSDHQAGKPRKSCFLPIKYLGLGVMWHI